MIKVNHNDDDNGLIIMVDLAGSSKESVKLDVGNKFEKGDLDMKDSMNLHCRTRLDYIL